MSCLIYVLQFAIKILLKTIRANLINKKLQKNKIKNKNCLDTTLRKLFIILAKIILFLSIFVSIFSC